MLNRLHSAFNPRLSQMLLQSTFLVSCSLMGLAGGIVPQLDLSAKTVLSFESRAFAESLSPEEVTNYAKAVLAIERLRQPALSQIRQIVNSSNMPGIACNQSDSANRLPNDARRIFVGYCQQSKNIVENYGLSPSRFNEITVLLRSNPSLQQKVRTELMRLQK